MAKYLTLGAQTGSPIKAQKTAKSKAARRSKGGYSRNPTKGQAKRGK